MAKYQEFVQTDANPQALGSQLTFGKGSSRSSPALLESARAELYTEGHVRTTFTGAWFGATSEFENVVRPFVSQFPEAQKKLTQGAWIDVARALADGKLATDAEGAKRCV